MKHVYREAEAWENELTKHICDAIPGGSHIDMVYVYVPAFWGVFSRNLV